MEKFSIHEVLEQAVQTERLGNQFYMEMAEKFNDNAELVSLFKTLAAKELKHEKAYAGLKELIGESDADVEGYEELSQYMRAIVESEFFLGKNKALPSMDHIKTKKEAVVFALNFEKETILYFIAIRDMVSQREVVDEIIREEQRHVLWLDLLSKKLS
ncbi:MAG TPA: ferritin family protein [Dissulfurispiraceae bacterium]|nr:ferritin family protein [Dissulfurispiraceae bacterium]